MKKYAIVIGENNNETSKKVQKALFDAGFEWRCDGDTVIHTDAVCLNIGWDGNYITYDQNGSASFKRGEDIEILLPSYVIAYAHRLEGAEEPAPKKVVKKMTVAEIAEELGYDVEVVKG